MPDSAGDFRPKWGKALRFSPARPQLPRQIRKNPSNRKPGWAMISPS